jgi:hypothetical protein
VTNSAGHSEQLDDLDVNRIQLAVEVTPMLSHSHPLVARLPSPQPAKRLHQETLAARLAHEARPRQNAEWR